VTESRRSVWAVKVDIDGSVRREYSIPSRVRTVASDDIAHVGVERENRGGITGSWSGSYRESD